MILLILISVVFCFQHLIWIDVNADSLIYTRKKQIPQNITYDINNAKTLFENFVRDHNRQYKDEEEFQSRYEIFVKNLIKINERNQKSLSEIYGITSFADMTMDEIYNGYMGLANDPSDSRRKNPSRRMLDDIEAPDELDWRDQQLVTPVKNQLQCNSCWAFSATGVLEGQYAKKHSQLVSLAEQELVDCWTAGGGCRTGSYVDQALNGASQLGGLMKTSDYPYTGEDGTCAFNKDAVVVQVVSGTHENVNDEDELKNLLYQYGPLSIGIFVGPGFGGYTGQVFIPSDSDCPPDASANHAVLLVGYGTDNGTPYWLIKNSWGEAWGDSGYLKLIRGKAACSILTGVSSAEIS